jgi:hypothetical protein
MRLLKVKEQIASPGPPKGPRKIRSENGSSLAASAAAPGGRWRVLWQALLFETGFHVTLFAGLAHD